MLHAFERGSGKAVNVDSTRWVKTRVPDRHGFAGDFCGRGGTGDWKKCLKWSGTMKLVTEDGLTCHSVVWRQAVVHDGTLCSFRNRSLLRGLGISVAMQVQSRLGLPPAQTC